MKGRIKSSKKRRACSFPSPKLRASDTGFPARRGNGLPFVFERLQKKTFPFRRTKIRDFPITNKRTANQKDWGEGKTLTPPGQDAPPHDWDFRPSPLLLATAIPPKSERKTAPFHPFAHPFSTATPCRFTPFQSPVRAHRQPL